MIKKTITLLTAFTMSLAPCFAAAPLEAYRSYIRGLLASKSGNIQQALAEYQRTTEMDKNAVYVYRDLAYTLWQAGKTEEAIAAAKKLQQSFGDDLAALFFLGSFYVLAGEPALARECWEKVLALDPENETALIYIAAFHASDNNPENAVSYWNAFISQEPDSSQAYYQLGLEQEKLKQFGLAKESYMKSLSLRPEIPEAHLSLAQIYEREEKYVAAAQEYEQYLELVPNNFSVMLYLGGLYFRNKNYDAAESVFLKAYAIDSADTNVCFWLGVIGEEKKDWDNAIKYFEILAKKENTPSALLRLSYYYSIKKDYKAAVTHLKKAIEIKPDDAVAWYMLGLAYMDLHKNSAAQKSFIKAKSLKPGMEGVSFQLGILYDQKGNFGLAAAEFENEIKANPDYGPALNYLGYSYADKGIKLDEAGKLIKKAVELEPDNGSYLDSLGWVYYKQGSYENAEKYLLAAGEKLLDTVIFEHLGDVYVKQNKTIDAWNAFRKAIDLDPKNKSAKKKVEEMEKLVLPGTLQRKALKRAAGNLRQVSSLKAGFSVSGSSSGINFRLAGFFQYLRPELWRVDVLGNFMAPQAVIIQNNGIKLYPEALGKSMSDQKIDIFEKINKYFNTGLIEQFDSDRTISEKKGNSYCYKLGEKSLVIDSEQGTVKEFMPDSAVIFKFKDYILEEGLYIPSSIEVYSGDDNINAKIRLKNCIINEPIEDSNFIIKANSPSN